MSRRRRRTKGETGCGCCRCYCPCDVCVVAGGCGSCLWVTSSHPRPQECMRSSTPHPELMSHRSMLQAGEVVACLTCQHPSPQCIGSYILAWQTISDWLRAQLAPAPMIRLSRFFVCLICATLNNQVQVMLRKTIKQRARWDTLPAYTTRATSQYRREEAG